VTHSSTASTPAMPAESSLDQYEDPDMIYFYLFKSPANQQWYFSIRSTGNHAVVVSSEGYHNKQDARSTIDLIRKGAANASVYDASTEQWAA
jgi:uncharacterized protein